ncbi:hypothetical protein QPK87_01675 [Kamptonema cortianum]|nr:hypothetical protein [Geitlerinema splendidum]MDK3155296.1 hypothetical protein [Kamptonema cortianum]
MEKDKKKLAVLGVLVVVILAVGAFSFMGGGSSETVTTTKDKPAESNGEGVEEGEETQPKHELDGLVALNEFSVRDPFAPPSGAVATEPVTQPEPPKPSQPSGTSSGTTKPPRLSGSAPVMPNFGGGLSTPFGGGQIVPETPRFRVKGILLGAKPLAVFEDSDGNQRLVPVGGSVDGETQVTGISQGKVTVKQRGKVKTLSIEEEARND